jgi:two-component system, OmpR family, sensor histidine kinase VanS
MADGWRPGMTIRARLTLTYVLLLTGAGAIMLALVYFFMRFVPTYAISSTSTLSVTGTGTGASAPTPAPTADPHSTTSQLARPTSGLLSFKLTSENDILNTLLLVSIAVLIVLALSGAIIGWIVAGRVLRPLKVINRAAQLAATGSLDHRVGLSGPRDEVRDLSDTFDDMLSQLDRSFQASQRFAANASHELRTPIATTQTMLEVALSDPELDLTALREVAERVYDTNRRNMQTVEALLQLAEIGHGSATREVVELDRIVADAVKAVSEDTGQQGVTVDAELAPVSTLGDPVLVRQAVTNLVRNAAVHNVDGGTVHVTTRQAAGGAELVVVNTGPVVPEHIIESLTEPFVRAAGRIATAGTSSGNGLGLAIATSVAEAEHGTLDLQQNDGGGLRVTLWLPGILERESVAQR